MDTNKYLCPANGYDRFVEDLTPELLQDLIEYVQSAPEPIVKRWSYNFWAQHSDEGFVESRIWPWPGAYCALSLRGRKVTGALRFRSCDYSDLRAGGFTFLLNVTIQGVRGRHGRLCDEDFFSRFINPNLGREALIQDLRDLIQEKLKDKHEESTQD